MMIDKFGGMEPFNDPNKINKSDSGEKGINNGKGKVNPSSSFVNKLNQDEARIDNPQKGDLMSNLTPSNTQKSGNLLSNDGINLTPIKNTASAYESNQKKIMVSVGSKQPIKAESDIRESRVAEMKKKINDPNYFNNPQILSALADKLLSSGVLD